MARIAPKLEVARGVTTPVTYYPRVGGEAVVPTAGAVLAIATPEGIGITPLPVAAVQTDGRVTFNLDLGDTYRLDEDYSFKVQFTVAGVVHTDVVYFDLVLVPLACPVDQKDLEEREPDLTKWLAAAKVSSAAPFIAAAWVEIVGRVRAAGYRPALLTDRAAFAQPCIVLALQKLMVTLIKSANDGWTVKHTLYGHEFETAWALIGPLKFKADDLLQARGDARVLPRFRQ